MLSCPKQDSASESSDDEALPEVVDIQVPLSPQLQSPEDEPCSKQDSAPESSDDEALLPEVVDILVPLSLQSPKDELQIGSLNREKSMYSWVLEARTWHGEYWLTNTDLYPGTDDWYARNTTFHPNLVNIMVNLSSNSLLAI